MSLPREMQDTTNSETNHPHLFQQRHLMMQIIVILCSMTIPEVEIEMLGVLKGHHPLPRSTFADTPGHPP